MADREDFKIDPTLPKSILAITGYERAFLACTFHRGSKDAHGEMKSVPAPLELPYLSHLHPTTSCLHRKETQASWPADRPRQGECPGREGGSWCCEMI
jgi:hypothetical protein